MRTLWITPLYNQIIGNYKKLRLETCLATLSCTSLDPTAVSIKTLNKIENHLIIRMIIVNHSSQRTIETAQKRKKIKTKYKINRKLRYATNSCRRHQTNIPIIVLIDTFLFWFSTLAIFKPQLAPATKLTNTKINAIIKTNFTNDWNTQNQCEALFGTSFGPLDRKKTEIPFDVSDV